MLESVKAETALTQERDEPAAGADAAAASTTAEDAAKKIALQVPDPSGGLARIGIKLALKKSQVRAGEVSSGASASAANPGSNIEAYFKPYHNWVEGDQGGRPIDILLRNLNEVRESLLVVANYPSQSGPANEKLRLQVVNLRGTVSRLPKPFARMIAEAVEEFEGEEAGSSKAQMNAALANITKFCQRVRRTNIRSRATPPATPRSANSRSCSGRTACSDKFFADYLSPITDMSGQTWAWQGDTRLGKELSVDTLRQFQRASDIRNAFFPDGGPTPNIQLTDRPEYHLPGCRHGAAGGQPGRAADVAGRQRSDLLHWPGNGGSGTANISLYPELPGRESRIGKEGPWALMRLIDAGSVSKKGEELIARFVIGGREVSYQIRIGSSYNPLFLPALGEFKCPAAF